MDINSGKITQINNNANTKYGKKSVLNVDIGNEEIAVWAQSPGAFRKYRTAQQVNCIQDADGYWTIVESESNAKATLPEIKEAANNYQNTVGNLLQEGDLPIFTEQDLVQIRAFIDNQAKVLKHCHEKVVEVFPETTLSDPRGARSLAVTLLISVNQKFSKIY